MLGPVDRRTALLLGYSSVHDGDEDGDAEEAKEKEA